MRSIIDGAEDPDCEGKDCTLHETAYGGAQNLFRKRQSCEFQHADDGSENSNNGSGGSRSYRRRMPVKT